MFRYTKRQIILHWAVVLLIAMQYIFAEGIEHAYETYLETGVKSPTPAVLIHIIPGILIGLLAIYRLVIRRSAPKAPHGDGIQDLIAKLTHGGLYLLMIIMPMSGMAAWAGGVQAAAAGHNVGKVLLMALIVLHVAGAIYHQFVLKDGLMKRMSMRG